VSVPEPIVIRRAAPGDIPALGQLGASLMRAHFAFDSRRFMAPGDDAERGYATFLETQMEAADSLILVAERTAADRSTQLVGYVYASVEPPSWKELREQAGFVHDLLVSDDAQRSGCGSRLLDEAVAWLRSRDVPRVVLWTAAPNERARRLFAGKGFRSTMLEMTLELSEPLGPPESAI
jgi:ribosomal protein S18 acetylase RimI-like enzyme